MVPLSCAHAHAHRGREMSAHKNLGAHINFPLKNVFVHNYFIHGVLSIVEC